MNDDAVGTDVRPDGLRLRVLVVTDGADGAVAAGRFAARLVSPGATCRTGRCTTPGARC